MCWTSQGLGLLDLSLDAILLEWGAALVQERAQTACRAPCRHSSTRRTSEYNGVHFHQGTPNSMDQFDCPHAKDQNSCKGFSRKLCLTVREERDHRRSLNDWHFYDQITSKRKDPRILLGTFLRTDVQAVKEAYFAKIPVIVLRDAKRRPRVLMWRCLPTARGRNPSPMSREQAFAKSVTERFPR